MGSKVELKLYDAFAQWAGKSDEKLTVLSLCEMADVSRASFYLYYKDIDDFSDKCREYIIKKLFEQVLIITGNALSPSDCKVIFDERDIKLLKAFTGNHDYWDFAVNANIIFAPKFRDMMVERWGEEYFENNKSVFEFLLNGSVASLYFDLVEFDKDRFFKNLNYITNIVRQFFPID